MDLCGSSENPENQVERNFFRMFSGHMEKQLSSDSLNEPVSHAGLESFSYQERKYSVLSTISEKDDEAEVNLGEDFTSEEPKASLDELSEQPTASEVSNGEPELSTTPNEKSKNLCNLKSEDVSEHETVTSSTPGETNEVSQKPDFQVTKHVVQKVQGMDIVLPNLEIQEVALIAEEINRQLTNGIPEAEGHRRASVEEKVEESEGKTSVTPEAERHRRVSVGEKVKAFEEKLKGSQKHDFSKPTHSTQEDRGSPDNDHQRKEIAGTSHSGKEEDDQNNYEDKRVRKPSPLVMPEIFLHTPEGQSVPYLPHRGTVIHKGNEVNDQKILSDSGHSGPSLSEWELLGFACDVVKSINSRQTTPDLEDDSSDGFMEGLYQLSTLSCCSIL